MKHKHTNFGDHHEPSTSAAESSNPTNLRAEFADMPLGELMALKERVGTKVYRSSLSANVGRPVFQPSSANMTMKKKGQHRPREQSSKQPVSSFRKIFDLKTDKTAEIMADPRFDDRFGNFDQHKYKEQYGFIEDLQRREKNNLKRQVKYANDDEERNNAEQLLKIFNDRDQSKVEENRRKVELRTLRKQNEQRLKEGKKPIFVKRGELKKRLTDAKLAELKKDGKLKKYLVRKSKKRKKAEKM